MRLIVPHRHREAPEGPWRSRRKNRDCFVGPLGLLAMTAMILALTAAGNRPRLSPEEERFAEERREMVKFQVEVRGVEDKAVLEAMRKVPRHRFVPRMMRNMAYMDSPLPIGEGQTISQPYIVALMTQLAQLEPDETVLEIGTGSGYQAAILAQLANRVWSIEILEPLGRLAEERLRELGVSSVHVRIGDGYLGWPEEAPFDAIVVTAAAPRVPEPLLEQLALHGRLVIPLGELWQDLVVFTKTEAGISQEAVIPVRFVPMVGQVQQPQ